MKSMVVHSGSFSKRCTSRHCGAATTPKVGRRRIETQRPFSLHVPTTFFSPRILTTAINKIQNCSCHPSRERAVEPSLPALSCRTSKHLADNAPRVPIAVLQPLMLSSNPHLRAACAWLASEMTSGAFRGTTTCTPPNTVAFGHRWIS